MRKVNRCARWSCSKSPPTSPPPLCIDFVPLNPKGIQHEVSPLPCLIAADVRRSGQRTALQRLPHHGRSQETRTLVSATSAGLFGLPPGANRGLRRRRRNLHRKLCVLQFLLAQLARARGKVCRENGRPLHLNQDSLVVELAANDGYLLQYVAARGIPCIGVEPTASTAKAAREKGIEIIESFFGVALAQQMLSQSKRADLIAANN